jgi:putative DNA primase/helicase
VTAELFADWKQWAERAGEFVGSQSASPICWLTAGVEKWRNRWARGFQGIASRPKPYARLHPLPTTD